MTGVPETDPAIRRFVRLQTTDGPRVGIVRESDVGVYDHDDPLVAIHGGGSLVASQRTQEAKLLVPIHAPEVWCAGVTYERSRDARLAEATVEARDVYALVYEADRPELFLKDADMRRTVGPGDLIRTRADSNWNVPEPELGVVIGEGGVPLALTVGNDVSSRDIEGANPLYIPQAKIFACGCSIGPALVVPVDWDAPWLIQLQISDPDGRKLFAGETSTATMKRSPRELVSWLVRDNPVPPGSVLLTGTGIVPHDGYTMLAGHRIEITIEGIGTLVNTVAPQG